jgi:alanine racemase
MINFFRQLVKPRYETLNYIELDAAKLLANFRYLASLQPQAAIWPVLKSNAYGHGLAEICRILNRAKPEMVVVESYPEVQVVYRYFKGRVLILGEMPLEAYRYCQLARTEFVVYNATTLRYLARYGKRAHIHLFVNTGMNREGVKNLPVFIQENKSYLDQVEITGLCSHLASADEKSELTQQQLANFLAAREVVKGAGFNPRWLHLGNSAGLLTVKHEGLNAYRPGLALYGYNPLTTDRAADTALQPVLEVFSKLVAYQELVRGESVSYNETYRAEQATNIGVIPFGYFEGLDRRFSNQAEFLVESGGNRFWAKVAGRVCMNLTCLDLGQNKPKIGDIVKLISSNREDRNSLINLANHCRTIPYELLVKLQSNIHREIINF